MARSQTNSHANKNQSNGRSNLQALFGARKGEGMASGLKLVDRALIQVKSQPRATFSGAEREELANSIRELAERGEGIEGTGILQPLPVSPVSGGDGYRLIAGERRLRAATQLGIERLPVIVTDTPEEGVLLLQIVENLQRQDLPPLEEARGIEQLMAEQNLSIREAAKIIGKDKGYLEARLNLLKYRPEVQTMVSARADSLRHARFINAVEDDNLRKELISAVTEEGISERDVRRRIEEKTLLTSARADTPETGHANHEDHRIQTEGKAPIYTGAMDVAQHTTSRAKSERPPDPIESALKPASAFAAEAARLLRGLSLTPDYRRGIQRELDVLKGQITDIEKIISDS